MLHVYSITIRIMVCAKLETDIMSLVVEQKSTILVSTLLGFRMRRKQTIQKCIPASRAGFSKK